MRFPKTLTYCCLLAIGTATLSFAQDSSDAQQKALDALRQYTAEKEGKTAAPLTTKPVQKSEDDAAAKELERKAREAARQKQQQEQPKEPAPPKAAPAPVTASTQSVDADKERKAREALDALRRESATTQALTAKTPATQPVNQEETAREALESSYSSTPAKTAAPAVTKSAPPQQMTVTAKPQPKTRKEKLNDLLELYMANTITPREYHARRATLIAGN